MRNLVLALSIIAFVLPGCGKDKDKDSKAGKGAGKAAAAAKVDCAAFAAKMKECEADFLTAYEKTEAAIRAGRKDLDSPGDGKKGAEYYKMGLDGLGAEKLCTDQYASRDGWWAERFNGCMAKASCAEWGACMGPAVGNPKGQ